MNFFWIYDLPNWQFLLLCICFFSLFSLLGAFLFRAYFEKWLNIEEADNGVVENFLSVSGIFYGITLGLIAVGSFENFGAAERIVSEEASTLNTLYRNVSMLDEPYKSELKLALKNYAEFLVGEGWKEQQHGIVPKKTSKIMNKFQSILQGYELTNPKDQIIFQEILVQTNKLSEKRRLRANAVQSGLPTPVWYVVFIGAFIITFLTWLLVIRNKKLDIIINILAGALLGILIFLIAAMDYPFRGEFSVSADPYVQLLNGVMKE